MKAKRAVVFQLPIVSLVLFLGLGTPCWSAESKPLDSSQVKQVAPTIEKPSRPQPSSRLTSTIQGRLTAQGSRVSLLLNQSASNVEVFSGRKKLANLGAGARFDVTPYLRQATALGLTFHYFTASGSKSSQDFKSQEILALSRATATIREKPAVPRPPKPRPNVGGAPAASKQTAPSTSALPMGLPTPQSSIGQAPPSSASGVPDIGTAPAAIGITSPTLGDFMVEGDHFVLQWSGFGNVQEHCVNIYLRKASGMNSPDNMTIAENVCINGYDWQLPTGKFGTGFVIKIRTIDNLLTATSPPFSILSSQPDLKITNLHIQPPTPGQLDDIMVRGDIQNSGHGTATASQVSVRLKSGNWTSITKTVAIPALVFGPNAHMPFSLTFSSPYSAPSNPQPPSTNMQAVATADSQGQVTEADEGNNTEQVGFSYTELPNLIPVITPEIQTGMSKKVKIQFRVRNTSTVQTPPTTCRTWIEKKGHRTHNVPAIPGGQTFVFDREVFFAAAGWRDYSLSVDYGNALTELYENDNVKSGRIHARSGIKDPRPLIPLPDEDEHPALHEAVDFWHGLWPWNWF